MDQVSDHLRELSPADADPAEIAREIARVVDLPKGRRPFRVIIDPADDGAAVVYAVGDRIRREFYHRIGFPELLQPATRPKPAAPETAHRHPMTIAGSHARWRNPRGFMVTLSSTPAAPRRSSRSVAPQLPAGDAVCVISRGETWTP